MKLLPKYNVLSSNYPNKHDVPAKTLLDTIGGDVRKTIADSMNTCAIRISDMLNRSGRSIRKMAGLRQLKGAKPQGGLGSHGSQPSLYIVRVLDMKRYLEKEYGNSKLIYDAAKQPRNIVNVPHQTQGIIVFVWSGIFREFGASGHVDLFHLWPAEGQPPRLQPECEGQCYWWTQGGSMKAYLWEATP